jgi:hypothetical protein
MKTTVIGWLAAALLVIPISVSAQSCAVTAPANGVLGNCPATLPSGSTCQFGCDEGYYIVGTSTSCKNGVLTAQTCSSQQACAVTAPADGTLGDCPSSLASGLSCSVACDSGYSISGASTSCTNGVLTSTQTCMPSPCSVTAPANGGLGNCPTTLASGSSCSVVCNAGYTLSGDNLTSCTDGELTSTQTCVAAAPTPPAGDAPIPLWALGMLGAGLVLIASRLRKRTH